MHVKSQPQNDFFGPVDFGRVVFWLSCRTVAQTTSISDKVCHRVTM
jgi:hypothetical protein